MKGVFTHIICAFASITVMAQKQPLITYEGMDYMPFKTVTKLIPDTDSVYSTMIWLKCEKVETIPVIELRYQKIDSSYSFGPGNPKYYPYGEILFYETIDEKQQIFSTTKPYEFKGEELSGGFIYVFHEDSEGWDIQFGGSGGNLMKGEKLVEVRCAGGRIYGVSLD